jgi:hypothetical protein
VCYFWILGVIVLICLAAVVLIKTYNFLGNLLTADRRKTVDKNQEAEKMNNKSQE